MKYIIYEILYFPESLVDYFVKNDVAKYFVGQFHCYHSQLFKNHSYHYSIYF